MGRVVSKAVDHNVVAHIEYRKPGYGLRSVRGKEKGENEGGIDDERAHDEYAERRPIQVERPAAYATHYRKSHENYDNARDWQIEQFERKLRAEYGEQNERRKRDIKDKLEKDFGVFGRKEPTFLEEKAEKE